MKGFILVGFLIAILLPVALSQPAFFGSCSFENVRNFLTTLPNGDACNTAEDLFVPAADASVTDSQLENAISDYCIPDCAGAQAQYVARQCGDVNFALGITAYCLPTGDPSGLNRCRFALPDYLDDGLINNLTACASLAPGSCSEECRGALEVFRDEVGCCYFSFYADGGVALNALAAIGYYTMERATFLANTTNPQLMTTCGVSPAGLCTGDPFTGTSTLAVGICTITQLGNFIGTLSDTCIASNDLIFNRITNPSPSQDELENAYDDLCTEECQGAIEEYENENCGDRYVSSLGTSSCQRTTGRLGNRCSFTFGESLRNASFFFNVGATCFANGPQVSTCPVGCQAALTEMSNQLGCCYQSFYNNTEFQNYLLLSGLSSFEEYAFLQRFGQFQVWDDCDVPLVAECTGDALGAGADRFVPSSIILILAMFSFILFN